MNCPQCGGAMWDNTVDKKNPKGPDYKCKDKTCAHPIWLDKKGTKSAKPQTNGAKWTWTQLSVTYRRALLIANQHVPQVLKTAAPADVVAAAATLFITATRDGVSEPKKEQPLDERPAALDDDDTDDIPF